ncbi:mammalian cell entry protein [Mycolicibacterium palauense]|uniref:mammalian cell entry protein n=1 Tax=Mycolicibacterium palauense TaxID=2034511 RepID=UPI000BFEFC7A|nr:mammalian cell entry protein [Mycolicibacterium palauense]
MADTSASTPDEATKPRRRRASRAAGPAGSPAVTVAHPTGSAADPGGAERAGGVATLTKPPVVPPPTGVAPPPRRRPNRRRVGWIAAAAVVVLAALLGSGVWVLADQQRTADAAAAREQRFVDTATQTVVNMFSYTQDNINDSVNRFVEGTSGPLRDMLSQNNNVENLKAIFRDTNASSEAVVNGAALEGIDEISDNGSVLVAVRVTVTDIDGVNKPSQPYRLRVIVHEDDNGRMTGYDLKYPDGGN